MKNNSGDLVWRSLLFNSLVVSGVLSFQCDRAFSQVTPDNTLGDESSVVNTRDATSDSIDGGAIREQNLFHSFEEFNVGEDRGVYFSNPEAVNNIFSRVTGNNVSNILGTLGVDGAANLFLINPNGIVFGEGASLDVQGSFAATTADGIEFGEQGFFSAVNPTNSVLTISVPLGLQFGSNPGSIINRSFVEDNAGEPVGLQVPDGENLAFIGGDISFEAGEATARGGNIEIGGLGAAGTVGFNDDGSLSFPEDVAKANITFSDADINVMGTGGGNIALNGRNISIGTGLFASSFLRAGITDNSTSIQAQAGDIKIDATDNLTIDTTSFVVNQVDLDAVGNAGNIIIDVGSLTLSNGGQVGTNTFGEGNAGNIQITATDNVTIEGSSISYEGSVFAPPGEYLSEIYTSVGSKGIGNAGDININTGSLTVADQATIISETSSRGNTGSIDITATRDIFLESVSYFGGPSGTYTKVREGGIGDAKDINIATNSLTVDNGGEIKSDNYSGKGNVGNITITAADSAIFNGVNSTGFESNASSEVALDGIGNAGNVTIDTSSLTLSNGGSIYSATTSQDNSSGNITVTADSLEVFSGGQIRSTNFNQGNSGNITIDAADSVIFDQGTSNTTGAYSQVFSTGNSGDINIFTSSLKVLNGAQFSTGVFGDGDAGDININAIDLVVFDGRNAGSSGAFTEVSGIGNSGNINISTNSLKFSNAAQLSSSLYGKGKAGNINIETNFLEVFSGSQIIATTFGQGNAGNVTINAGDLVVFDNKNDQEQDKINSGIFNLVEVGADGNAGNINISTNSLKILNGAQLSSSTRGKGNAASITIAANNSVVIDGEDISGTNSGIYSIGDSEISGNGGDVTILTDSLEIYNGGLISSSTFGQGDVGSIDINAFDSILVDGQGDDGDSSGIFSSVQEGGIGNAGVLNITTDSLTLTNDAIIITTTLGQGNGGELKINANSINLNNNASISSRSESPFNAGNITLNVTDSLQATDSSISTSSSQSSGGNLTISAGDIKLRGNSDITTNIFSGEGSGGNIAINADSIIAFDDSDIFAFAADGQGGNITLDTPAYFGENFTLNSLTSNPDSLENNSRADINATGAVSGSVTIPDVSSIQNSLTELANDSLNTDELVANSCVVPVGDRKEGKFIITGTESLPVRPGDGIPSKFPTGEVRSVPEKQSRWQPGDPIVEPQGAYRLANGKLVLSRECSR
jgi:filamentous hemagglutinin family protein